MGDQVIAQRSYIPNRHTAINFKYDGHIGFKGWDQIEVNDASGYSIRTILVELNDTLDRFYSITFFFRKSFSDLNCSFHGLDNIWTIRRLDREPDYIPYREMQIFQAYHMIVTVDSKCLNL